MNEEVHYLEIANSSIVFILCAIVILIVSVQAILFIKKAYNRGLELGMTKKTLKRAMTNSAMLSVVPSLPIIVMMLALSVPLGKYFPWLRLSIVGSAGYEGMAANIAAQSQGLTDISDPNLTAEVFIIIMFVMTIGIIWGILFNILFMGKLDQVSQKAKEESHNTNIVALVSGALFTAMLITLSTPYVFNTENISSLVAFLAAGLTTLIIDFLAKRFGWTSLKDYSLPVALIVGMGAVILQAQIF
ncbi:MULTISPECIES: DUF5058 family protein [Aerococcus]|uniref:DUF5058 family protein n=1 Tax=Aerococcus TaxID=1375 RepID=UPI0018A723FC|nr:MULTISPECIES: DUF5058 family protein [Aerococcus]MCY3035893.1 DUF5058 family protein [Aerococcus sp. Group 2]MCY3038989.1 DUF5058 family protein [Aerococcus sp. Group 2]MCY3040560.1 DUF5058 family protein [Aerococcus sp. Group 2]MCY3042557.1 DUF5058 family protein [Aerococcus sp. Group 2]MDK6520005.1 DUF5058 family protein [Aerococcus urinae]